MRRFRITVEQLVDDAQLTKPDDRISNPTGHYLYAAESVDAALDAFHSEIPIGCLDDFEVSIELFTETV